MPEWQLNKPVAFIIFNRPDTTEKVFAEIRKAKPPTLLVVADGPRQDVPGEAEKCMATRQIVERVDWPCKLLKKFSETNLGCGIGPATGITWIFEQVEEAIVLEDDCLPHSTFFRYCEEFLDKYRDDTRIMHIAGNNRNISPTQNGYAHHFSLLPYCWGWASWRRAWKYFDFEMNNLDEVIENNYLEDILGNKRTAQFWAKRFKDLKDSQCKDIWDFQWTLACWTQSGLSVVPNINLVKNIGFDESATHTKEKNCKLASMEINAMHFPLQHPPYVINDAKSDRRAFEDIENALLHRFLSSKILKSFRSF